MSETETRAWWVTSDPDHPVNAAAPIPEAPLMSEPEPMAHAVEAPDAPWMPEEHEAEPLTPPLPDHVADALHTAQTPGISDAEREAAVRVLLTFEAEHQATNDAHPSTIPDDLIPAQYQAKAEDAPL
jgi:hypothetical protein